MNSRLLVLAALAAVFLYHRWAIEVCSNPCDVSAMQLQTMVLFDRFRGVAVGAFGLLAILAVTKHYFMVGVAFTVIGAGVLFIEFSDCPRSCKIAGGVENGTTNSETGKLSETFKNTLQEERP